MDIGQFIEGNVNATRLLIQSGSYVDERDNANQTPLHLAVQFGNLNLAMGFFCKIFKSTVILRG